VGPTIRLEIEHNIVQNVGTRWFYLYREIDIYLQDEFSPLFQNTGHQDHESSLDQQPFCEGDVEMFDDSLSEEAGDWVKFHYPRQFPTIDSLSDQPPSLK
jgi:hypothetical protein